jgi:hypothetical protein
LMELNVEIDGAVRCRPDKFVDNLAVIVGSPLCLTVS